MTDYLPPAGTPGFQPARVVEVIRETPSTVTVVFATDTPLAYRPGQFVRIEFLFGRGRYRRAYSLCSVPGDPYPAITVKQVPGGKVSEHIVRRLAVGDTFRVSAAEGAFLLPDSRAGRRFVLLAGGSGITPVMSLLRTLLAMPQPPSVTLLYYSHSSDDIIFRAALHELAGRHPSFDLRLFVTGPRESWDGPVEPFSERHLAAAAPDPASALYYLCGPEALLATACSLLAGLGVPPGQVLVEHFATPPIHERPAEGHLLTFLHRGLLVSRRTKVKGRPGESLLDAAERSGLRTRSRCRNGSCGSCRAVLVRGDVVMDEPNSLTVNDARAGRILTCISYAVTPAIIDLRN
ncbi:MAG: 2Fe-2S iron-sulfur cluster-binding protein [Pseudomonadota bacterium]